MKKTWSKINIGLLLAVITFGFTACGEDYFDVNTPSGYVKPDQLRMNDLLAPVIHSTMEGQQSAALVYGNYTQYFVSEGGGASGETELGSLWNQVYLYILPNLKEIKQKSAANNAIHFEAVADVLTAINLGIATDSWGNIPYSEATQGQANFSPTFDTQEAIYTEIFALLDSAITNLQAEDTSGFTMGSADLIYKGDTAKWLKAAYTLKARYQLHLVNKGVVSPNEILTTISNGIDSNDANFLMAYDEKNLNPWHSSEVLSKSTGNFHRDIASQLVSTMNGENYPFTSPGLTIDPRLPVFADNDGAADWRGYVSGGGGESPDGGAANTGFAANTYYTSNSSPLVLITYAEAMFIKAEAAFLANGGTTTSTGTTADGYDAYIEGVNASMAMYSVDGATYVSDANINVGVAALQLHHIMKEKYIHNFLNPETFVDYRRYDFSTDVFKGLTIRSEDDAEADYAGQWFRRASYPTSERNANSENVEANQQTPVTPVWWDE
ncbi:MAG: SusD/RagB family nutrient-binding outer membrane lipoprotein [Flavobacteriaceae bacterium]|nr:SusD/RagB family nutrient-binding outer membrane lipoprotein [Flavobacteriaceae bacterium]